MPARLYDAELRLTARAKLSLNPTFPFGRTLAGGSVATRMPGSSRLQLQLQTHGEWQLTSAGRPVRK